MLWFTRALAFSFRASFRARSSADLPSLKSPVTGFWNEAKSISQMTLVENRKKIYFLQEYFRNINIREAKFSRIYFSRELSLINKRIIYYNSLLLYRG